MEINNFFKKYKNNIADELINIISSSEEFENETFYIIDKPMLLEGQQYTYNEAVMVLRQDCPIVFIDLGNNTELFNDYVEEILEDLAFLSKKYNYEAVLGRKKHWEDSISITLSFETDDIVKELLNIGKLSDQFAKNATLLVTLLVGNINDISRIGKSIPDTILEKVKKNIILFDSNQNNFIYDETNLKVVQIQGMAGTGKTELLLHKLREIYTKTSETKVLFTCHNKILAESFKKRIPEFFDFMKVEEQIRWNERLYVAHGWGSIKYPNTGTYAYICNKYNLPFSVFSYNGPNFDDLCKDNIKLLKNIRERDGDLFEYAFDFTLIDESQDFPDSFVEMCEIVTKEKVYVAGDIFQNIFERRDQSVTPQYILNRSYRTDPRTFMFSHLLSMGIVEDRHLSWLEDSEWEDCGYNLLRPTENNILRLSREPVKRFDFDSDDLSTEVISILDSNVVETIIRSIGKLKEMYHDITPSDIGVVFLSSGSAMLRLADRLSGEIYNRFKWESSKAHENRIIESDKIFISNKNHAKGLEFPFVICVANDGISDDLLFRNSLYMVLTRSFIKSILIIEDNLVLDSKKLNDYILGLTDNLYVDVREPKGKERDNLLTKRIDSTSTNESINSMFERILDEYEVPENKRENIIKLLNDQNDYSEKRVREIVKVVFIEKGENN